MRVGLCFNGLDLIHEMIELARLADETGMESIWMSDHLCSGNLNDIDGAARVDRKIKVAAAPASPYSRNPLITAMAIATMDEFAPGRAIGSPGTGNAAAQRGRHGVAPSAQNMREYVNILRALFARRHGYFHGKMFKITAPRWGLCRRRPSKCM